MERTAAIAGLMALHLTSMAQVRVDGGVVLTGPGPAERQVLGLPDGVVAGDALTAGVEQAGAYRFTDLVGGPPWEVLGPAGTGAPVPGTHLLLRLPGPVQGPLDVLVNGHGPFPLSDAAGSPIDAAAALPGTVLSLVFDGTVFRDIGGTVDVLRDCPQGMASVGGRSCVEVNERAALDWFAAALACAADGRRLCSWGEFMVACVLGPGQGLQNLTNNWEWTGSTANSNGQARIAGSGNCYALNAVATTTPARAFRCCATR